MSDDKAKIELKNPELVDMMYRTYTPFILAYRQGQRDERERIRREVNAIMSKASPAWREPLAVTMDMILMDGKQEMAQD